MSSANNFNNEIILYHRQQANRTLKIRIEESPIISKIDLKSWSSVEEEIPCDIVGVGAAGNSGKKGNKKSKPVKIRFHPEVLKEARKNGQLSEAAKLTAHKLLDQFFGHEWTMDQPKFEDFRHKIVQKLRNVFTSQTGFMVVRDELALITWPLPLDLLLTSSERKNKSASNEVLSQFFTTVKNALRVWVYPYMETKISNLEKQEERSKNGSTGEKGMVQILDLNFDKNGFKKNIVQLEFVGCPLLRDSMQYVHNIELDQENAFIRIYLRTDPSEENFDSLRFLLHGSVRVIGATKNEMIDCAQVRVETLRQTLDDSLKQQFPRRNSPNSATTGSMGILMKASSATTTSEKRPLEVLYQSGSATCIQISGSNKTKISRFNVSPTPNPLPAATIDNLQSPASTSPRPLHIIVNDENSRLPTIDECAPIQTPQRSMDAEAAVSTSPSDSIDSGVASPGDSPTVSPVSTGDSCTVDDSAFAELKMRDRSVSEGVLNKPNYSPNDGPLKSILKKPKFGARSPSFNGGLKRSPAVPRLLFSRSMSESHERDRENEDDDALSSILNGLCLNSERSSPRMFNSVFDEDDELSLLEDVVGSQTSMNDEQPAAGQLRKKRVSFSDQVQARIYRSNSSILGQRRKNDKKKEKRLRRRSESESSDTTLNEDGDATLTKSGNSSLPKGGSLQELFIPPKHNELLRHDSGISDLIEAELEAKTCCPKVESNGSPTKPRLGKRVVSEDSAIGFEDEEVGEASV